MCCCTLLPLLEMNWISQICKVMLLKCFHKAVGVNCTKELKQKQALVERMKTWKKESTSSKALGVFFLIISI